MRSVWSRLFTRCSIRPSRPAARRCGIIVRPPANSAISSTRFRFMIAKAKNARQRVAVELFGDLPRTDAQPSGARNARSESQDCRAFDCVTERSVELGHDLASCAVRKEQPL